MRRCDLPVARVGARPGIDALLPSVIEPVGSSEAWARVLIRCGLRVTHSVRAAGGPCGWIVRPGAQRVSQRWLGVFALAFGLVGRYSPARAPRPIERVLGSANRGATATGTGATRVGEAVSASGDGSDTDRLRVSSATRCQPSGSTPMATISP